MSLFGASTTANKPPGSLFGQLQPASNAQPTTSLFGATNTSQPGSTPSLFGNTTSAAPAAGSAAASFGGGSVGGSTLGGSTFGGSTFGGNSLFGATNNTQSQPSPTPATTSGGGLFGGSIFGSSQAPATQIQGPGPLFGASTAINDNSQSQALQPPTNGTDAPRPALFEDLLERGRKRRDPSHDNTQSSQLPSLQLGLGDISARIKGLGKKHDARPTKAPDSSAHYMLAASGVPRGSTRRDLDTFGTHSISGTNGASRMVPRPVESDIETYVSELRAKTTREIMQESMEQSKRDFDIFLEQNVQMNWDEQRRRIYEHFGLAKPGEDLGVSANNSSSIGPRGAFGRSSRTTRGPADSTRSALNASFGASSMNKSVLGGSVTRANPRSSLFTDVAEKTAANDDRSVYGDPFLRTRQERYSIKVKELNIARIEDKVFPLVERFRQVEIEAGTDAPKNLLEAYRALGNIVKENPNVERPSEPGAIKARQYAQAYLDENANSALSISMKKRILAGSLKYTEDAFFRHVEETVEKNPHAANAGGIPTKTQKIRGYIRLLALRKDLGADSFELVKIGDDYCWALIYHLLRAGLVKEAVAYVNENERAIKSMDRYFLQYINAYATDPERRLKRDLQAKIDQEYHQRARVAAENSCDPYRLALYKIIGRCELSNKTFNGISFGVDDLIWIFFNLAREVNRVEEAAGEAFGLAEVQEHIEDIASRYFARGNETIADYSTLFHMQIMCGMFENAVMWLYQHNPVAAVHFAIALDFYGLLRVADFNTTDSNLLTHSTRNKPQISFARLLGYYTRDFRLANAEAATDYLTLICLNSDVPGEAGRAQASVCHEGLKELVLETREFALLLGDIRPSGEKFPGAIQQRLSLLQLREPNVFLKNLTIQAARVADDNGRTTDAVLLYHLAEEYDNVIFVLNRALSDALATDIGADEPTLAPLKPRLTTTDAASSTLSLTSITSPVVLARSMLDLYSTRSEYSAVLAQAHTSCSMLLLDLHRFKAHLATSPPEPAVALDTITALGILPLGCAGNISLIRSAAAALNTLPAEITRNIGAVLVWTISACAMQREVLKGAEWETEGAKEGLERLASDARDLMVFAGLIRYKVPGDVFEMIARAGGE